MEKKPIAYSYIRFSTPEQAKGSSLERQIQESKSFAEKSGWILDDSLNLRDLGISAFRGKNIEDGALGHFLKLVESGKIKSGSILLVESLDRLSRDQVTKALDLFLKLINSGITIATTFNNIIYTKDFINSDAGYHQLYLSIGEMVRSHMESRRKAGLISDAWARKRAKACKKKLTGICPAWLRLNEAKTEFIPVKERVAIIGNIFELYLKGLGAGAIAKKLNQQREPSWGKSKLWHKSYIQKILHNRAVIGEYQPCRINDGKRVPEGDPISDYYPAIIDNDLFYQAQEELKLKGKHSGGKNGPLRNLFALRAYCRYCRSPMVFIDKGKAPKGGQYLVCSNAKSGAGCMYLSVSYPLFEEAFLKHCAGLNISDLLSDETKERRHILKLDDKISAVNGQIAAVKRSIENLSKSFDDADDVSVVAFLKKRLSEKLALESKLNNDLNTLSTEKDKLSRASESIEKKILGVQELIERMKKRSGEDDMRLLRLNLRSKIRRLIKWIRVEPYDGGASCIVYFNDVNSFQFLTIEKNGKISKSTLKLPKFVHEEYGIIYG